jgi:hypothetical protein
MSNNKEQDIWNLKQFNIDGQNITTVGDVWDVPSQWTTTQYPLTPQEATFAIPFYRVFEYDNLVSGVRYEMWREMDPEGLVEMALYCSDIEDLGYGNKSIKNKQLISRMSVGDFMNKMLEDKLRAEMINSDLLD